jgi:hypothetical protein
MLNVNVSDSQGSGTFLFLPFTTLSALARPRGVSHTHRTSVTGGQILGSEARFEEVVKALTLRPEAYASSLPLKACALPNKNHKYVPSELLALWGIEAESEV